MKNLPVILSLIAGFIVCVVTWIYQYQDLTWIWILLGALVFFYLLGLGVVKILRVLIDEIENEDTYIDEDEDEDMNDGNVDEKM